MGITNVVCSGGTVTATAANTFVSGESVAVTGVSPSGYNTTATVSSPTPSQFSYSVGTCPGSYTSGGTASAAVTAGSYDSGTGIATITVANSFAPGQEVVVTGVSPGGYDGTFSVTSATSTTVSYSPGTSLGSWSSGGTVSLPMPGTASCGGATVSVCYSYDAEDNRTQMMGAGEGFG